MIGLNGKQSYKVGWKTSSNSLRKTDFKKSGVVYIWNPHHYAYPPSYFSFWHGCNP